MHFVVCWDILADEKQMADIFRDWCAQHHDDCSGMV